MGYDPTTLEMGTNSIRFVGNVRGLDDIGHDMFAIRLDGSKEFFGEVALRFAADRTHYDVEVKAFGYGMEDQAPSKTRQIKFANAQQGDIKRMIEALVRRDCSARNNLFGVGAEHFTGDVVYASDWVQLLSQTQPNPT
jgi:hypothetical protein